MVRFASRSASVMNRTLRFGVLPAVLLSLTACGTMDAAPTAPDLTPAKVESKGKGKPVNVLKEGSFEYGTTAWTADPASVLMLQGGCAEASPHKGMGWARFGASEASAETLSQTVTIPKGRARLEFYLYDAALGDATLEALVDGQVLFSYTGATAPVVSEPDEDDLDDEDDGDEDDAYRLVTASFDDEDENEDEFTEGYEKVKFDVSGFADGGPHTVSFRVTDGASGAASLSVDDAALTVKLLKNLVPEISQDVSALKLHKSVSKPLVTKLDKAAAALARRDAKTAIKELKAFAKEVRGHRGKKIKAPAADDLVEEAKEVIEVID